MANSRQATFVRLSPNPMRISGELVHQGDEVTGDFDILQGLPGMQFIGWADQVNKYPTTALKEVEDNKITTQEEPTEDIEIIGFDEETLKELKSKTPREWMSVKKTEIKKIMDDAGIDYSGVKDDRMALYKFLAGILKEL
jgi:hypothetical protein